MSISGIRNGLVNLETNEMAALAIRKSSDTTTVLGTVFDIPESELPAYLEREHRYKPLLVEVTIDIDKATPAEDVPSSFSSVRSAWTVVEQTDEEYRATMSVEEYTERVSQHYDGMLWGRPDIFPMRKYSNEVIAAAHKLGGATWVENLILCTMLSDRNTRLVDYYRLFRDRIATENDEILSCYFVEHCDSDRSSSSSNIDDGVKITICAKL